MAAFYDNLAGSTAGVLAGRVSTSGDTWATPVPTSGSDSQHAALNIDTVSIYPITASVGCVGVSGWTPPGVPYGAGTLCKIDSAAGGIQAGPLLRFSLYNNGSNTNCTFYCAYMDSANSVYGIVKCSESGGSTLFTVVASVAHTFSVGDQHYLYLTATGTTTVSLTLYVDGVSTLTYSDTTPSVGMNGQLAGQIGVRVVDVDTGSAGVGAHIFTVQSDAQTAVISGASTGVVGVASANINVTLEAPSTLGSTATLSDSGGGGTFTPTGLTWAAGGSAGAGATLAPFTYTPASTGTKNLTVIITNASGFSTSIPAGAWVFTPTSGAVTGTAAITLGATAAAGAGTALTTTTGSAAITLGAVAGAGAGVPTGGGTVTASAGTTLGATVGAGSGTVTQPPLTDQISFDSVVRSMLSGYASTATVTPLAWAGTSYAVISGADFTLGTIYENTTYDPGSYSCRVTINSSAVPPMTVPRIAWDVGGELIVDVNPLACSVVVSPGITPNQASLLTLSAVSAVLLGLPVGPIRIYDPTATFMVLTTYSDSNNNRTGVTYAPPSL